jgi:hypothetical protein
MPIGRLEVKAACRPLHGDEAVGSLHVGLKASEAVVGCSR